MWLPLYVAPVPQSPVFVQLVVLTCVTRSHWTIVPRKPSCVSTARAASFVTVSRSRVAASRLDAYS